MEKYRWLLFQMFENYFEFSVNFLWIFQVAGDWTGDLWNFLNPEKKLGVVQENLLTAPNGAPIFRIDGPYGAASEEVKIFGSL